MELMPFDQRQCFAISADVRHSGEEIEFTYQLSGDTSDIVVPGPAEPVRADGLWQATCFEAFISMGKSTYVELNFAPSGKWAAYRFTSYRQDMSDLDIRAPTIRFDGNRLAATVELSATPGTPFNLAAVIEHRSGLRSYWALAHPRGNRPDFHDRDCFVAKLP